MNSYPFLDNKIQVMSDAALGDIVRPVRKSRVIDISDSPFVPATELRSKLQNLLVAGELDSGLPILRDNILTGLIPAPELEFALDDLEDEGNTLCLMALDASSVLSDSEGDETDHVDFGQYIDPVGFPVSCVSFNADLLPRHLSLLTSTHLLTLFINALQSWVCGIYAFFRTDSTLAWCIRRHS